MANLMITKQCNLHCEYCFANEFVGNDNKDIMTMETFKELLDFIFADKTESTVGFIGGEPTLHPDFSEMLNIVRMDERIKGITVYTNGLCLDKYIGVLDDEKIHLLINCNDLQYDKLLQSKFQKSLDLMYEKSPERIVLGLNYYKTQMNCDFIFKLLERYNARSLRISISVPNGEFCYNPLEYFEVMKIEMIDLFDSLYKMNVLPHFDCNIMPACVLTSEDVERYPQWSVQNPFSIAKNKYTVCRPVIDFLPDKTAVRCFGLSEHTKVNVEDFASITDLKNHYIKEYDAYAVNTYYSNKCSKCYKYKTMKCSGGCLTYKMEHIQKLKEKQRELFV